MDNYDLRSHLTFPTNPLFQKLIGEKFGRLTVLEYAGKDKYGHVKWLCRCICNKEITCLGMRLKQGFTKSCGCLRKERISKLFTTHGASSTHTYKCWQSMLGRCRNPSLPNFSDYGGRGINICERWEKFENFLADMGFAPTIKHSLDRIDNDGDYKPENCRWATIKEQNRNRRDTRLLTHQGKKMCIVDWANELGISESTIRGRLRRGCSVEEALSLKK